MKTICSIVTIKWTGSRKPELFIGKPNPPDGLTRGFVFYTWGGDMGKHWSLGVFPNSIIPKRSVIQPRQNSSCTLDSFQTLCSPQHSGNNSQLSPPATAVHRPLASCTAISGTL